MDIDWKFIFCRLFVSILNDEFGELGKLREPILILLHEATRRLDNGEYVTGYSRKLSVKIYGIERLTLLEELNRLKLAPFKRNLSFMKKEDGALEIKASFCTLYYLCEKLDFIKMHS